MQTLDPKINNNETDKSEAKNKKACRSASNNQHTEVFVSETKTDETNAEDFETETTLNHLPSVEISQTPIIKVLCWNIRGLGDKITHNDTLFFLFSHDIILFTETHNEKSEQYYNCIPGFIYKDYPRKFKHRNAPKCSGG